MSLWSTLLEKALKGAKSAAPKKGVTGKSSPIAGGGRQDAALGGARSGKNPLGAEGPAWAGFEGTMAGRSPLAGVPTSHGGGIPGRIGWGLPVGGTAAFGGLSAAAGKTGGAEGGGQVGKGSDILTGGMNPASEYRGFFEDPRSETGWSYSQGVSADGARTGKIARHVKGDAPMDSKGQSSPFHQYHKVLKDDDGEIAGRMRYGSRIGPNTPWAMTYPEAGPVDDGGHGPASMTAAGSAAEAEIGPAQLDALKEIGGGLKTGAKTAFEWSGVPGTYRVGRQLGSGLAGDPIPVDSRWDYLDPLWAGLWARGALRTAKGIKSGSKFSGASAERTGKGYKPPVKPNVQDAWSGSAYGPAAADAKRAKDMDEIIKSLGQ